MLDSSLSTPEQIYQLKITLVGSKPPIWRRVEVSANATLSSLHRIIQVAMGWYDYHLHQFTIDGVIYGIPHPEDFLEVHDERLVLLYQVITGPKMKFRYEYDFGDNWEHTILVEKVLPPAEGVIYPRCVTGKRACPPEDCGGIYGYTDFLEAINTPDHPAHAEMLEWSGGSFDPEAFDCTHVNDVLQRLA